MIELIIFDLDGVLVDIKKLHFDALNEALSEVDSNYIINHDEHLSIYDGLKTKEKLNMLTRNKGLPEKDHDKVWSRKQQLTMEMLDCLEPNEDLIYAIKKLKESGFKVACCSNSIVSTINKALEKIGVIEYFDNIQGNDNAINSKPHPELYWRAMITLSVMPEKTLIVEDSPIGLLAAKRSGAHFIRVNNSNDLKIERLESELNSLDSKLEVNWKDPRLNVVIPMAGSGTRFQKAGYTFPKPLIDVNGKPMIQWVVDNLGIEANFIFIVQKTHREKYNLDSMLNLISPKCKIVEVDGITDGAACTTLLAKEYINNDAPMLMANSDQFLEWASSEFLYKMYEQGNDGGIVTFKSTHPKWSFAKTDDFGKVLEVAEKNPISDNATAGIYYWKHGSDYVKYAEQMIAKEVRVNNEFYVCPVFNEAIEDGKDIKIFNIEKMWGLGTPEDLNHFLNNYERKH